MTFSLPKTQTVALVRKLGGPVEFDHDYPVPTPGPDEVLAKVLYTGVCQSDLHTAAGTAAGPDGQPITAIALPHIGGHEGVARIISLGPGLGSSDASIRVGALVGVRFLSRICHHCEFCLSGREQYCQSATNHLHHEAGAFQQYVCLDARNLTLLPGDIDPVVVGPVLCAGVTTYKAVRNASLKPNQHLVVIGAGGGLGSFAVGYGIAFGYRVLAVDTGADKRDYLTSLGASFLDFKSTPDLVAAVQKHTEGGAHAVLVCAGNAAAFTSAVAMLRINGTLCLCGIPPGGGKLDTTVAEIAIKGITIRGNLVGSLGECLEAVELVRTGRVKPLVKVRKFEELPRIYEELKKGDIVGRVVLKIAEDEEGKEVKARL